MRTKYRTNPGHQEQKSGKSRESYADPDYRKQKLEKMREIYNTNPEHKEYKIGSHKSQYLKQAENNKKYC